MITAVVTLALLLGADPLTVTLKKSGDSVVVTSADKQAVVAIQSPSGIGSATLRPVGDKWPESLQLKLRLKGLEGLSLQGERIQVRSFLASRDPEVLHLRDGKWIAAEDARESAPKIKQEGGLIIVDIPAAMLDAAGKELRVDWVDFYRG